MSFEMVNFRGADQILKSKKMETMVQLTLEYLNDALTGALHKRELLNQALEEMDWRHKEELNFLNGRRYYYKGFHNRVAIDGNLSNYEYVQDALFRLQVGYDKKFLDMGIVLVTGQRSQKSPLGCSKELVKQEIELLYPTISLPVTIVLFDLSTGPNPDENERAANPEPLETQGQNPEIPANGNETIKGAIPENDLPSEIRTPLKKKRTRKKTSNLPTLP